MSPQLGKLGTRHRGPFSRKICICSKPLRGLEPMRDHQTGCFVADSYQMSFSVKANTGAAFVSFHANVNGPDLPLAYSFSLLVAGTA